VCVCVCVCVCARVCVLSAFLLPKVCEVIYTWGVPMSAR